MLKARFMPSCAKTLKTTSGNPLTTVINQTVSEWLAKPPNWVWTQLVLLRAGTFSRSSLFQPIRDCGAAVKAATSKEAGR